MDMHAHLLSDGDDYPDSIAEDELNNGVTTIRLMIGTPEQLILRAKSTNGEIIAPMLGKETKYGLGVISRPTRLGLTYGHSGFFPGYMTDMMYFPDKKIAVAVQVNSSVPQNPGKSLSRVLVETAEIIGQ